MSPSHSCAIAARISDTTPRSELLDKNEGSCILMRLPILKPLEDRIPADLQRYEKYIQPEPFRPVTILAALHDIEAFLGNLIDNSDNGDKLLSPEEQVEMDKGKAFTEIVIDFVLRELLAWNGRYRDNFTNLSARSRIIACLVYSSMSSSFSTISNISNNGKMAKRFVRLSRRLEVWIKSSRTSGSKRNCYAQGRDI